jgi:hypothetical protein
MMGRSALAAASSTYKGDSNGASVTHGECQPQLGLPGSRARDAASHAACRRNNPPARPASRPRLPRLAVISDSAGPPGNAPHCRRRRWCS